MAFDATKPDYPLIEEDQDFRKILKIAGLVAIFSIGSFMIGMAVANISRLAFSG